VAIDLAAEQKRAEPRAMAVVHIHHVGREGEEGSWGKRKEVGERGRKKLKSKSVHERQV
jgi:hypothetical protein